MLNESRLRPVYKSINKPLTIWEVERRLFFLSVVMGSDRDDVAHIDLELATEKYRPGHMSQKARAGFKLYDVNSANRGHRAEWEGQELTADVLAF